MRTLFTQTTIVATIAVAMVGCSAPDETGTDHNSPSARVDRQAIAEESERFQVALGECLTERGYASEMQADGALKIANNGDSAAMHEVLFQCEEDLGGAPEAPLPDDAELSKYYDLQVKAYECLVAHGHTPDPPSTREAFVQSYNSGPVWTAHSATNPPRLLPDTECPKPTLADIEW